MYVLVLASQKGGSGKTTLSGHLAVEAERSGLGPVALIDTDPQGSLSEWWNARVAETPYFAKVALGDLSEALAHLQQSGVQLAVIDTPPAITESIAQVVAHADLVLIPTRPSPHDLRAVGATVEIAERHNKPLVFVMNAATARARITGEAAVALSQHGTVAPVTVHHRVDFAASMVDGRTVGEVVPKSTSAKEIAGLWTYVQDRLSRVVKDSALATHERAAEFAVQALTTIVPEPVPADEDAEYDFDFDFDLRETPEVHAGLSLPANDMMTLAPEPDDRRSGSERRTHPFARPFGVADRRVHPFGRRHMDRPPHPGNGSSK